MDILHDVNSLCTAGIQKMRVAFLSLHCVVLAHNSFLGKQLRLNVEFSSREGKYRVLPKPCTKLICLISLVAFQKTGQFTASRTHIFIFGKLKFYNLTAVAQSVSAV